MKRITTEQRCISPVITYSGKVKACDTPIGSFIEGTTHVKCLKCLDTVKIDPSFLKQKEKGPFK